MGFSAGIIVFAIDCLKTIAAYATASLIFNGGGSFFGVSYVLPGLYAGLGAVLGHNFPFFMKLKGGKGIAATGGLILALDWRAGLLSLVVFLLSSVLTRRISVGSLLMTLLAPFMFAFLGYSREVIAVAAVLTAMAWTMHRGNIKRLLNGTEPATSFSKKTKV
jgi:glycerol-3-phosphate acyltransferase PlsY